MANKPINRFEIQVVFSGGAYLRWESRKGGIPTVVELADVLERYLKDLREMIAIDQRQTERAETPDPKEPR